MLAGRLLAEAATVHEGRNAVQTESYGPEARGGKSKTDVVISDEEIDYPKATRVDVLLAMTQAALDEYGPSLREGGTLLVDSYLVERIESPDAVRIPFTKLAIDGCGRALFANVIALGAVAEVTGVVAWDSIRSAVLARVPKGTEAANEKALSLGRDAVIELRRGGSRG
ncbi:MAG: 2-oxoacid:acceptor oxidoreductase family protein [Candidatus Eisenbacteria bacterium]|nr:2-oxoacid:acceptor oxidoreductase family protein [Candidatus Eisenbacteria bacterium]